MITYTTSLENIQPTQLAGFFVGWPNPPTPEAHLRILAKAYRIVLAIDSETLRVVGFINAISDGIYAAYIPLLEVLPEFHHRGIGNELVTRMLEELRDFYMVDAICDPELESFYQRFGMFSRTGMAIRHFDRQSGA